MLISHLHYDHLDVPSLRSIEGNVKGIRDRAGPARCCGERALRRSRPHTIRGAARWVRERSRSASCWTPACVYFAGDTDLFAGMSEIGPVDLALLPGAGWGPALGSGGHLDPESVARAAALIRPKVAVPIHWGTLYPRGRRLGSWFTDPGRRFAAHVAEVAPDVVVRVLAPGVSLALTPAGPA